MDDIYAKPQWRLQTLADLKRHEGFREFAYPDPDSRIGVKTREPKFRWGYESGDVLLERYGLKEEDGRPWTVGYGFTLNTTPASRISLELATKRLDAELVSAVAGLDSLTPHWRTMPLEVQTVLANMIYNLGYYRLKQFRPTLNLFELGKFPQAADRLVQTLWYKQTGLRAKELVSRLRTGKIEDSHLARPAAEPLRCPFPTEL